MSSIGNVRKSPRGRPAVNATPVTVRIPPDQLAALDAWIAGQAEPVTRPEAVRRLLGEASRGFTVPTLDVEAVREQIGLSQSEFARLMCVSIKTIQNWEQHRRNPTGPASALLKIIWAAPDVVLKTLHA